MKLCTVRAGTAGSMIALMLVGSAVLAMASNNDKENHMNVKRDNVVQPVEFQYSESMEKKFEYGEKNHQRKSKNTENGTTKKEYDSIIKSDSSASAPATHHRVLQGKKKSSAPSSVPSFMPSSRPSTSILPSTIPTNLPSISPSDQPSLSPSACRDEPDWQVGGTSVYATMNCTDIKSDIDAWCDFLNDIHNETVGGKRITEACCDCGGGDHATPTPSTLPSTRPSVSNAPSHAFFPSASPTARPSVCADEPGWTFTDKYGHNLGCEALYANPGKLCLTIASVHYDSKPASLACCVCGGGNHLSVSPSKTPTSLPSSMPSLAPSLSSAPSDVPSLSPSDAPSNLPSQTPSENPSVSIMPSNIPSMTFAAVFDGDYCNYDTECRERPKYSRARRLEARSRRMDAGAPRSNSKRGRDTRNLKGIKKRKTSAPSAMPSSKPSSSPSDTPSKSPSDVPSKHPSDVPSAMPSTSPSSIPSSPPSDSPSDVPSKTPSDVPSKTPSSSPSQSPSDFPSLSPSESPTSFPSDVPSLSTFPSAMPQHYGRCIDNTCQAEDLEIQIPSCGDIEDIINFPSGWYDKDGPLFDCNWYAVGSRCASYGSRFENFGFVANEACCVCGGGDLTEDQLCPTSFSGSYGNMGDDGTHDQDFAGGAVVGPSDTLTLFGNAWKAYKLCEPYEISKTSYLTFKFLVTEGAEGHAVCLDEDLNEDTFGGSHKRCVMLTGTQTDRWDNVKKYNIGASSGANARQSTDMRFLIGDADKAVDGIIHPYWSFTDGGVYNSITETQVEEYPWWEVSLDGEFIIQDVIIYNRLDPCCIDNLSDFNVTILNDDSTDNPNDSNTVWELHVTADDSIDKYHATVSETVVGRRVRITLNKEGSLQLAEVQIIGFKNANVAEEVTIPIGDMFFSSGAVVNYISFIQDNDGDNIVGESEFSEISIKEDVESLLTQSFAENTIRQSKLLETNIQGSENLLKARIDLSGDAGTSWEVTYNPQSEKLEVTYDECQKDASLDISVNPVDKSPPWDECQPDSQCDRCGGDCDDDADCAGDLVCNFRSDAEAKNNPSAVGRSCSGSVSIEYDYCVPPETFRRVVCSSSDSDQRITSRSDEVVPWMEEIPTSISVASTGRFIVGFENAEYEYFAPTTVPSGSPSESQLPTKAPTDAPTVAPTDAPTTPIRRMLMNASRHLDPDDSLLGQASFLGNVDGTYHGVVVIYDPKETTSEVNLLSGSGVNDDVTQLDSVTWEINQKIDLDLLGDVQDLEYRFGSAVAISSDGGTIAVGSPGYEKGRVEIYNETDSDWIDEGKILATDYDSSVENFGKRLVLSTDGTVIAVAAETIGSVKDVFFVFQRNIGASEVGENKWSQIGKGDMTTGNAIEALSVSVVVGTNGNEVEVDILDASDQTTVVAFELVATCSDPNAKTVGDVTNAELVRCFCRDGYLSSGGLGQLLQDDEDFCVPCMSASNLLLSQSSFTLQFSNELSIDSDGTSLTRHEPDEDVEITINADKFQVIDAGESGKGIIDYTFFDLQPGMRYTVSLTQTSETDIDESIECPVVTSCSCDHLSLDRTGRPKNLIVYQKNGHVMLNFTDNSYCEEGFSFTRVDVVDEFMFDASKFAVSFTSDFQYSAADECNAKMSPGMEVTDDLSLSSLEVGKEFAYCVRAVKEEKYMDSPYVGFQSSAVITSSGLTCKAHIIRWEASIHGLVTTEPDAGRLPIEHVLVSWNLLDAELNVLQCDGCSGSTNTTDGGSFQVVFNVLDDYLAGKNEEEIPVKLFFSKTSPPNITHEFLCEDGAKPCDTEDGYIVYLSHLQFKKSVHIYDDTSVPFSGRIFVADTAHGSEPGCAIPNAEVCLVHNSTRNDVEENLVCVDADARGNYIAPVIIGSTVHNVKVFYHDHTFEASDDNPGPYPKTGLQITADGTYLNHNFKDVTKAEVTVEVVGGKCDKRLGTSTVLIKMLNCDWEGKEYTQSGTTNTYLNVPAHFLHLEVKNVVDGDGQEIELFVNHFQGSPPIVREIDLLDTAQEFGEFEAGKEDVDVAEGDTGLQDEEEKEEEEEAFDEMDGEVKADRTTVRFQFDGKLIMEVIIEESKDELSCDNYDETKFGTGNSFHVMNYMTLFKVRVNLEYEIYLDKIYCDIVEDGLQIKIDNNVGVDIDDSWEKFYNSIQSNATKAALTHCWSGSDEGTCSVNVTHTTNDEGENTGNAGLDYSFATGRPNIVSPFTKSIIFTVKDIPGVDHVATFFIEGLYSKGPGNSFALPTHEPIMILRDPPGGSSSATYEYVQSTVRIVEAESEASMAFAVQGELEGTVETDAELCTGGGLGAIVLACGEIVEADMDIGISYEGKIGGQIVHTTEKKGNEFTTTWSYSTSDDPLYAGFMSDVFVVPNLNVFYEIVYVVAWKNEGCHPDRKNNGEDNEDWPSKVLFDVNAESSQNSLAFYSRFQILDQKIPELEATDETLKLQLNRMENGELVCCCVETEDDGECPKKDDGQSQEDCACTPEAIKEIRDKQVVIQDGLKGWTKATNIEVKKRKDKKNIVDWFTSEGIKDMNKDDELELSDQAEGQSSSILPPTLVKGAVRLDNEYNRRRQQALNAVEENVVMMKDGDVADEQHVEALLKAEKDRRRLDNSQDKLAATKRIQFDGGAGMFEMKMSKELVHEWSSLSCWLGCNINEELEMGAEIDFKAEGAGFGVEGDKIVLGLAMEVEHTSMKGGEEHASTEIGFALGDPDLGDEFVVEVYFDDRYGTMVFETLGGRSACPHEENTLKNEDPIIVQSAQYRPSQFVFPDDPMVFMVDITNMGVGAFSEFKLYSTQSSGMGGLSVTIDGTSVSEDGTSVFMLKDTLIRKQVVVTRNPYVYQDAPVEITLQSKCEDPKNTDDYKEHVSRPTIKLSNTEDGDGNDVIEWVQPCPVVKWAGELNRDRGFLVNSESKTTERLSVTVFNPEPDNFATKKQNGRLEKVLFKYRKVGSLHWSTAKTVDINGQDQEMDFAGDIDLDKAIESDYGYATLEWNIEPRLVKEGNYEVYVETICTELTGGPSDINGYQTEILSGVIDYTLPKQYGEPLPLSDTIIPGEEIVVVFDEDLDCSKPFSFDVELRIEDIVDLNNDQLMIRCEGRMVGFQIDTGFGITYEDIVGKSFEVEIGSIGDNSVANLYDVNGNALEYNIAFSRSFSTVTLSSASSSFRVLVSNYPCTKKTNHGEISKDITNSIASAAGLTDGARISMHDISCQSGEHVSATIEISPATTNGNGLSRRFLREVETSTNILYKIRDASVLVPNSKGVRRLDGENNLAFVISDMKLLPSEEDLEKYQTHPDRKDEEKLFYSLALGVEHSLDGADGATSFILKELKKEQSEMKREREVMEKDLNTAIKEIEQMFMYSCAIMATCIGIAVFTFCHLKK